MTDEDDVNLNPHGTAYRAAMKGWPRFHYCTYGERLIVFNIFGVRLDLGKVEPHRLLYIRIRNAGTLFVPFIGCSLTWPMPDLLKAREDTHE